MSEQNEKPGTQINNGGLVQTPIEKLTAADAGNLSGQFTMEVACGGNAIDPSAENAVVGDVSPVLEAGYAFSGTLIMSEESMEQMRVKMTYNVHPHSIEGRLEAMEKRFERLLEIVQIGEYNETVDNNWNKPLPFPTTGKTDYPAALRQELVNFRAAMKEMHEGPVYLRVYPDGSFKPEHWDV